jgi:hypothetical protein
MSRPAEFVEHPTDYGNLRIATLKDPEWNLVQVKPFYGWGMNMEPTCCR